MTEEKSEFDILFPGEDIAVFVRGEGKVMIRVEPFGATQIKPAAKLAKPLLDTVFSKAKQDAANPGAATTLAKEQNMLDLVFSVVEDAQDPLIEFVAFCIGKPKAWFDGVLLEGLYDLAEGIYRQNSNFFARRIMPLLQAWMPGQVAQAGATSLADSSTPGTESPTSTDTP